MAMIAALLLLFAPLAQDRPDPKAEAERRDAVIAKCHIAASRLVIVADDPSFDVLRITGHASLSDAQLRCYARELTEIRALWPQLEDATLTLRYTALVKHDRTQDARNDLRQRGVLAKLPRFDSDHDSLDTFAVRLETLCQTPPHSALVVRDDWIAFAGLPSDEQSFEAFGRVNCAVNAAIAAGYDPVDRPAPTLELPAIKP